MFPWYLRSRANEFQWKYSLNVTLNHELSSHQKWQKTDFCATPLWACSLTGFLREFRVLFWGHVLEVFANGICVLAVQNTTPELLRIGWILCVCLSVCLMSHFFCSPFFDDFCEEFICDFRKKTLKKGDPGRHTTPRWTVFWLRPDPGYPRSLALSSSCACGATCPAGSF